MDVEGGANLYVGQAGDNFNNVFAVSPVCFAALLEFKWFLCNGINCEMTRGIKQSVYILQSLLDRSSLWKPDTWSPSQKSHTCSYTCQFKQNVMSNDIKMNFSHT